VAGRWPSEARARAAQQAETNRFPECGRQSVEREAIAKEKAYPLLSPVVATSLPAPAVGDSAHRITYVLRLSDGPATYYLDAVTLWRGRISVDLTFFSIDQPFDAANRDRVIKRVEDRLSLG
jgi:hypothetical protein